MSYYCQYDVEIAPHTTLKAEITTETLQNLDLWYHESTLFVVGDGNQLFFNRETSEKVNGRWVYADHPCLEGYVISDNHLQDREFVEFLRDNMTGGVVTIIATGEDAETWAWRVSPGTIQKGIRSFTFVDETDETDEVDDELYTDVNEEE